MFERLRTAWSAMQQSVPAYYRMHRTPILAGITVLAVLLVVWARFGFTLDVSRFYATSCTNAGSVICRAGDVMEVVAGDGYRCEYNLVEDCGAGTCTVVDGVAQCTGGTATPTVALSVNKTSVAKGGTVSLSWTSTNATSCVRKWDPGNGGQVALSGGEDNTISPTTTATSITYTIECTGGGQTARSSKTVTITGTGTGDGGGDPACGPTIPKGGRLDWSFRNSEPWPDCQEGVSNAQASQYWTEVRVGTCHPDNGFHLVWRAQHRPKATCNMKNEPVDVEMEEGKGIVTNNGNFDDSNNLAKDTAGVARMTYTTSTFNCGSVYMFGAFWADDPENPEIYRHNNAGNTGYVKVINYGVDCGAAPAEHNACKDNACVKVAGAGTNECDADEDCKKQEETHKACKDNACVSVAGAGTDECDANSDCEEEETHLVCRSNACKEVSGAGRDECVDDNDCEEETHMVCRSDSCEEVDGAGRDECDEDKDCEDEQEAAPQMTLAVTGRNATTNEVEATSVSVRSGQQVEVISRMRNPGDARLRNAILVTALPAGLVYVPGSTTIDNAAQALDSVATSGINVGSLAAGSEVTVKFRARVDGATFPSGTSQTQIVTTARADGVQSKSGSVVINIVRDAGPSPVQAGPGDAVAVALLVSAAVSLLYVSYTHSDIYRKRQLEDAAQSHDPLDFRG